MTVYAHRLQDLRDDLAEGCTVAIAMDADRAAGLEASERAVLGALLLDAAALGRPFRLLPAEGDGFAAVLASVNRAGYERRCRVCGCSDFDCRTCVWRTGRPCTWVARDLCSACWGFADLDENAPEVAA